MDIHPDNLDTVDDVGGVLDCLEQCFARHFYRLRALDEVFIEGHPLNPDGIVSDSDLVLPGAIFRRNFAVHPPVLFLGVEKDAHPYMKLMMKQFINSLNADMTDDRPLDNPWNRPENVQPLMLARVDLTRENLKHIAHFIGWQSSYHLANEIGTLATYDPELGALAAAQAMQSIQNAMPTPEAETALKRLLKPQHPRIAGTRDDEGPAR